MGRNRLPPLFISFQDHLFTGCSDKRIVKGFLILSALFAFIIILFPAKIHSLFLGVIHIAALSGCTYILFVFTKAIKKNLDGALISLLAFLVPFLAALNDMLTVNNYIHTEQMLPYGLIVYFVAQPYVVVDYCYNDECKRKQKDGYLSPDIFFFTGSPEWE